MTPKQIVKAYHKAIDRADSDWRLACDMRGKDSPDARYCLEKTLELSRDFTNYLETILDGCYLLIELP